MKALLLVAAASLALSAPLLALAQNSDLAPPPPHDTSNDALGPGGDHPARPGAAWSLEQREQWVAQKIQEGQTGGKLTADEAANGQAELKSIRGEQARLTQAHGGLTQTDHHYLEGRLDQVSHGLGAPPWGV